MTGPPFPLTLPARAISSAPAASVYDRPMRRTKERSPDGRTGARRVPASCLLPSCPCSSSPPELPPRRKPPRPPGRSPPPPRARAGARAGHPRARPGGGRPLRDARGRPPTSAAPSAAAAAGDIAGAAALLDRDLAAHPGIAGLHAARAGVAMIEDAPEAALDHLAAAAAAGLPDIAAVAADPLFAPLAADPALGPRLAALAATPPAPPPAPVPAPIADGVAPVTAANTAWNPAAERLEAFFAPPEGKPGPVAPRPAEDRRPRHPPRALEARPRRRQRRRPLRQPRPRPLGAEARGLPPARPCRLFPRGAGGRARLRPPGQAPLRPPDPRQLLDRGDRRRPLAQPPPPRDDRKATAPAPSASGRTPRPTPSTSTPPTRTGRPSGRPLPGEHPLHPRQPRLLGLGPALPRGLGADLRRLPPRHQGAARRRSTCSSRPCR